MVPVPVKGVSFAAGLLDRYEQFPITRDQIRMLLEGNTCAPDSVVEMAGTATAFNEESLTYLSENLKRSATWSRNAA
jgi:NADH dehydrogenase